ncbi:MAG: hypothetical protein N2376_04625, partial [Clostridia bacterium]|nr:hypothetical protein [Clostridia bacterium]
MSKKILALILCLTMVLSVFTACGRTNSASEDKSPTPTAEASESAKAEESPSSEAVKADVSVKVPDGWTKKDDKNTLLFYEKDTSMLMVMTY